MRLEAIVLSCVVALSTGVAHAAPSYEWVGDLAVPGDARGLVAADFNGDGDVDVAAATGLAVAILLGNGNGSFAAAQSYPTSGRASSIIPIVASDFNHDRALDIAVSSFDSFFVPGNVSVLLGSGDGSFGGETLFQVGADPLSITVGDFNEDLIPDLATANRFSDSVSVLLGDGSGGFESARHFSTIGFNPNSIVSRDFDEDGHDDLATSDGDTDNISLFLGDGTGDFSAPLAYAAGDLPCFGMTTADVDGDDHFDIGVPNCGTDHVSILLNNGDGVLFDPQPVETGQFPRGLQFSDLDNDNLQDLVVSKIFNGGFGRNEVVILKGNSDASFDMPSVVFARPNNAIEEIFFAIADFSGDGWRGFAFTKQIPFEGSFVSIYLAVPEEIRDMASGLETINHELRATTLDAPVADPVVITGVPTFHGPQPGVVRVQDVSPAGFEMRFQEWLYLDGSHADEEVPWLVAQEGRRVLADGAILQAGTFELGGTGAWQEVLFAEAFPGVPALFLTLQTSNGGQPVVARASEVDETGFAAALFEEQALMDGHATETVGYLAVWSPTGSGTVTIGGEELAYLAASLEVNHRFTPFLSSAIKVEEEKSLDSETNHLAERLSLLAFNGLIFGQDVSARGADTAALRRTAPEELAAGFEWGVVEADDEWVTVPLAGNFADPVIVAKPATLNGAHPGEVRVTSASGESFRTRFQEWPYLDGHHAREKIFYMVAEAGPLQLGALRVEAGRLDSNLLLGSGWEVVDFSMPFAQRPELFTAVMTGTETDAVVTRNQVLDASGFEITMQEQELGDGVHATETLGWIAIQRGRTSAADGRQISVIGRSVDERPVAINLGTTADHAFPFVLANIRTTFGADPVALRVSDLRQSGFRIRLQEAQSADAETGHTQERASLFISE